MRRYFIIAAVALILIGVGVAVYFFFFTGSASVTVAPAGSATLPTAGKNPPPTTGTADNTPSLASGTPTSVSARLVKISVGPVALGEAVIDVKLPGAYASTTASSTSSVSSDVSVNYIERNSGNIFSYLVHAKTLTRTSNRTVPGIESATWLPDTSIAFVRYLSGADFSTINTYALPADGAESGGFFLPQNLADVAASATAILTLASGVNGSVVSLARTDGSHTSEIFTTPLSALHVSFAGKGQYLAYTKPSATLPGDAFIVDSAGRFSRIAGPLNGLVALASPSGKWVLVSYTLDTAMQMELVNVTTGEEISLPVTTIADKCVWAADDSAIYCGIPVDPPASFSYPDDWYQGAVSFSDRIWKIQVANRYAQLILDFSKENQNQFDAEALSIDSASTVLVFKNKNDGSLWSYSL